MISEAELLSSGLPKKSEQPLADLQEDQHLYPEWCRRESLREALWEIPEQGTDQKLKENEGLIHKEVGVPKVNLQELAQHSELSWLR